MRPKQPRWTAEEFAVARSLVESKATNEECIQALGRSLKACSEKVRLGFAPEKVYFKTPAQAKIPEGVRAEAAKRSSARPRDLAGMIFGDPPQGYSALERRT